MSCAFLAFKKVCNSIVVHCVEGQTGSQIHQINLSQLCQDLQVEYHSHSRERRSKDLFLHLRKGIRIRTSPDDVCMFGMKKMKSCSRAKGEEDSLFVNKYILQHNPIKNYIFYFLFLTEK